MIDLRVFISCDDPRCTNREFMIVKALDLAALQAGTLKPTALLPDDWSYNIMRNRVECPTHTLRSY